MTSADPIDGTRGPRVARAAVVALGVVAILLVQGLLTWALGWGASLTLGQGFEGFDAGRQVLGLAQALVFTWIPFGLGVLLALALLAPLAPGLPLGRVLGRAVLAALVGAGVAWLGTMLGDVLVGIVASGLFPAPAPSIVGYRLVTSLQMFVATVPAVALVALLVARVPALEPGAGRAAAAPGGPAATPGREV